MTKTYLNTHTKKKKLLCETIRPQGWYMKLVTYMIINHLIIVTKAIYNKIIII